LMITDVVEKGTEMLVAGDVQAVARSFGVQANDSMIELPGVMSRKKEVAPTLMSAF
jgi:manganese-dependent inorganic pyrophosphatase